MCISATKKCRYHKTSKRKKIKQYNGIIMKLMNSMKNTTYINECLQNKAKYILILNTYLLDLMVKNSK